MSSLSFRPRGLKEFKEAFNAKRVERAVNRHLTRATALNGRVAVRHTRNVIRQGKFGIPKDAPLTIMIKRSRKPLVDHADLWASITTEMVDKKTAFVGVLRSAKAFDVARIIHDGATFTVTPAMRGMFMALYKASIGELSPSKLEGRAAEIWASAGRKRFLPISPYTTMIVIPERPFMDLAFDGVLKKLVIRNWEQALAAAFAEIARSASSVGK